MSEIELKFGVAEEAADAIDKALRQLGARSQAIGSRYWDSADRRLARAGLSLRLRKSAGRWEQTLKAVGPSPAERLEETVPRPGRWNAEGPPPELWLHAGTAAGTLLDSALARRHGRAPALERVHASLIRRRAARIEARGAEVEVAFDRGAIVAGERSLPVCEVEIELKHGDVAALVDLARANVDAHGMWLSTIAKAARGDRLAGPAEATRAVKARPARLRDANSGEAIFRALIHSCLDQVLANASVLAAGDVDDDVVHQLRVGLRRMRTAWRELEAWHGSLAPSWEAPAAAVFRALGEYRDRRSVAASMQQRLAAAGSPEPVLRPPTAGGIDIDPVALVRARSFQHALLDVLAYILMPMAQATRADDAEADPPGDKPEHTIGRHLGKLHARLKGDARRFEQLDELERHGVRKRLKRLRYLSEMVTPLYRGGRAGRFLGELEPAQDELGHYMDVVVAIRLARGVIDGGDARAWFNVGWLKAQLPRAVERCRKALQRVAAASPFWRPASSQRR
jgi:triphosphatase